MHVDRVQSAPVCMRTLNKTFLQQSHYMLAGPSLWLLFTVNTRAQFTPKGEASCGRRTAGGNLNL